MADNAFAMKLSNDLCLECSICAMFFSSSFTVSITALFLIRILSLMFINTFFMLFLILVISWIPSKNKFSNKVLPIYPLSAHSFPWCYSERALFERFPIIHISSRKHKVEDFPFVVDNRGEVWIRRTIPWNICHVLPALQMSCECVSFDYGIHAMEWNPQNWYRYTFPAILSW